MSVNEISSILSEEISLINILIENISILEKCISANDWNAYNKILEDINSIYNNISNGKLHNSRIKASKKLGIDFNSWGDISVLNDKSLNNNLHKLEYLYKNLQDKIDNINKIIDSNIKLVLEKQDNVKVSRKISGHYRSLSRVPKLSIFIDKTK